MHDTKTNKHGLALQIFTKNSEIIIIQDNQQAPCKKIMGKGDIMSTQKKVEGPMKAFPVICTLEDSNFEVIWGGYHRQVPDSTWPNLNV